MKETHRLHVIPERYKRNLEAVEAHKGWLRRDLCRTSNETSYSMNHPVETRNSKQETVAEEESPLSSQNLSASLRDASSLR